MRRANTASGLTAAAASLGYPAMVRRCMSNSGATAAEAARTLPGDDLVLGARGRSTLAATLNAPLSQVWLWLVQMGCNRAGFYGWDRLDNGGRPSAERLHASGLPQ